MNAPRRLLDDASTDAASRRLLEAHDALRPPPGASAQVRAALITQIGPAGDPSVGAPPAGSPPASPSLAGAARVAGTAKAAGGPLILIKPALVGAGLMAAILGGVSQFEQRTSPPAPASVAAAGPRTNHEGISTISTPVGTSQATASAVPERSAAPEAPRPAARPAPGDPQAAPPRPADAPVDDPGPAAPSGESGGKIDQAGGNGGSSAASGGDGASGASGEANLRASQLREEASLVRQAREALRGGEASRALGLLDEAQRTIPGGALGQEREALAIEALARSGQRAAAAARAAEFLRRHPTSPHAAQMRSFAE
jgi:hypothetical protein